MHSWWIPGTRYRRASNRGCITTLLLPSSIRSNRRRTQHLPWGSVWKLCMLTVLFFMSILPQKWCLKTLRSEAQTQTSRQSTNACMMNNISGQPGTEVITELTVMNGRCAIPYPAPAGDCRPRLNLCGLTWEPVMSTGMMARMAPMQTRMRWKKYRKPMIDQLRMWRTAGIIGLTCQLVMSTVVVASIATMRMRMRRNKHRKPMRD